MLVNTITHFVKVVVEVHISSTEVAPKEGGVSREYGCHINLEHPQQDKPHPRQPLMEVSYNQWSGTWSTFPELKAGGEGREGEGRINEETRGGLHESHHAISVFLHTPSNYCRFSSGEINFDISLSTWLSASTAPRQY